MFSVSKFAAIAAFGCATAVLAASPVLRVCADPNNLPFSNRAPQGFENHIARLVANDLGMQLSYYWFPQREAFFRKTLNAGRCDVVLELPEGIPVASPTAPYYRSSYEFITRHDRHLDIQSMDDPRLRHLKIGVHITGDSDSNLPPVNVLIERGLVHNLMAFSIYGNLSQKNPPADLIQAVANGQVDIAIAWGPMASHFARRSSVPLDVTPIEVVSPNPAIPLTFAISMGIRRGDQKLRNRLNTEILRRKSEIRRLLQSYDVPLLDTSAMGGEGD